MSDNKNYRGVDYTCGRCGVGSLKLWREYNTFLEHQTFLCASCASPVGQPFLFVSDNEYDRGSFTDQIWNEKFGTLVPAVPTEEGDTFWGYTSTPFHCVMWWYDRPTYLDHEIDRDCERNMRRQLQRLVNAYQNAEMKRYGLVP